MGVVAGLVIMLMSVTGVLLGFERQMIAGIDGVPTVQAPPNASRLSLDDLLQQNAVRTEDVASVAIRVQADEPVRVRFRDRERAQLLLDPYRGDTVLAPVDGKGQAFFSGLRRWHRWMGATGGELRTQLRAVTGAANLIFLLIVLSGIWLWWPTSWRWRSLRNVVWFRRGLRPKARDFNWHNTIGFWSAIPLALVVASGVFISYSWPEVWLDAVLGETAPVATASVPTPLIAVSTSQTALLNSAASDLAAADLASVDSASAVLSVPRASLDALAQAAMAAEPDWSLLTISLPEPDESSVSIAVAGGNTYRPDRKTTLITDANTAAVLENRDYASLSTARQIRAWVRFGHTGEVFGLMGQLLATIVTAAGAVLVWTGIALSWRRFRAWRARSNQSATASSAASPAA